MKTFTFFLILALAMITCANPAGGPKDTNDLEPVVNMEGRYYINEHKIGDCEYLVAKIPGGNVISIIHKADCGNPKHGKFELNLKDEDHLPQ